MSSLRNALVVTGGVLAVLGCFYLFAIFRESVIQRIKEDMSLPVYDEKERQDLARAHTVSPDAYSWTVHGKARFEELAYSIENGIKNAVTDKVTSHSYQTMYGKFLYPLLWKAKETGTPVKFLEIGLGCNMGYGPGKSVKVWQSFWGSNADIWFGEYDAKCVDAQKKAGRLDGIKVVTGDQGDFKVLERWLTETGGNFDVIIDDGGHRNAQIQNTFQVLFNKALNPGGIYVIEDMQVGRSSPYFDKSANKVPTTEMIQDWIDQLNIDGNKPAKEAVHKIQHKLPLLVDWIFCQREACVIGKCAVGDTRCEGKNAR